MEKLKGLLVAFIFPSTLVWIYMNRFSVLLPIIAGDVMLTWR